MSIINRFPSGGGGLPAAVSRSDVNFYDYDGTLLFAYTIAQANALPALPAAPTHTGLTFQEWNYTLTAVNATTRPMDVGATYITDDGKTRLYIRVWDLLRSEVPLVFSQTVSEGVTIDWGDESAMETFEGTGVITTTHTYAAAGDYTISLDVAVGCELGVGDDADNSVIGGTNYYFTNLLVGVQIGSSIAAIASRSFNRCYSLRFITISNSVMTIGEESFYSDYSLQTVVIPSSVNYVGLYAFQYASSLRLIILSGAVGFIDEGAICESSIFTVLPLNEGLQIIGDYVCTYDPSLTWVYAPSTIISIGIEAFSHCTNLAKFHIYASTPPTLGVDAFMSCAEDLTIYVPTASLSAYQAAEGWSTYSSIMVGE